MCLQLEKESSTMFNIAWVLSEGRTAAGRLGSCFCISAVSLQQLLRVDADELGQRKTKQNSIMKTYSHFSWAEICLDGGANTTHCSPANNGSVPRLQVA